MTIVIDKGPSAGRASKKGQEQAPPQPMSEQELWEKENPGGKPVERNWSPIDAAHAVQADPDRYSIVHEDHVNVYDLGPPVLMERRAAEALVATDRHRYSIKDPAKETADAQSKPPEPNKHPPDKPEPPHKASLQHR